MQERVIPQNITDFYRPSHQILCQAIFRLRSRNEPVDLVTVTEELKKENRLEDVGDISYLTLLANVAPTAANVKYHARIVEEKSLLRQMVESGTAIAAMGYEGGEEDVQDLIDRAEKNLLRLSCRKSATDFVPIQDIVSAAMDRLWAASDNLAASNIFIDDTPAFPSGSCAPKPGG